jgi:hypothetical protein
MNAIAKCGMNTSSSEMRNANCPAGMLKSAPHSTVVFVGGSESPYADVTKYWSPIRRV